MPTTIKGVWCPSLRLFRPLLNNWITANVRFVRYWQGDLPWWYNERASISVLAGAAWMTGGLAFEEYTAPKRTGKKRHPTYSGRVDLYLKVKEEQFIAEAKYYWSGATSVSAATSDNLREKLKEACDGIRICPRLRQRKLGILFATPYIAKSQKTRVDELARDWVAAIRSVKCSCCAWVFPKEYRYMGGQYVFPGAAVLIQEV